MALLKVAQDGTLLLSADLLQQAGLRPADQVQVGITDSGLELRKPDSAPAEPLSRVISRKNLQTGIQFIKGVGPKLSDLLAKRGVKTVEDALFCLPLRYEDRRELVSIRQLKPGTSQVFFWQGGVC